MILKIIKIDGEFVIAELENGQAKVCPIDIFPGGVTVGDVIRIEVVH